jgi:hypothetical protein
MQKFRLLFELSPWLILVCLLAGAGYAFILYKQPVKWGKSVRYTLASIRFILVSLLCFLLLGPFFRLISNKIEQPTFVFAIDNSTSVTEMTDEKGIRQLEENIRNTAKAIRDKGYQVAFRTFSEASMELQDSIAYDYPTTDLHTLLKGIQADYEGKNIGGVILLTDGIYNQGISPAFNPYSFPVHTIGLGDTIPQQDINLKTIYHNKLAYQGNKFPLVAEVANVGFKGQAITVSLKHKNKVLATKTIKPNSDNDINEVKFIVDPEEKGMQHYVVEASPLEGEFTTRNNVKHAYIDIIEGKEKVLIAGLSPHPDIKAIRNALLAHQNYEVSVYIPEIHAFKDDKYDLIIFHQVPDNNRRVFDQFRKHLEGGTSAWYILGGQSNLDEFNKINSLLKVNVIRGEKDNVMPAFNEDFSRFLFKDGHRGRFQNFPPVKVPFGKMEISADCEVILYQKVGSIVTHKPLLAVSMKEENKTAVMLGEGMWQWRMDEYAHHENYNAFDELVTKLVQFLSAKDDKRRFKVYPVQNEFYNTESVVFETEIYNQIYEKVFDHKVNLEIKNEAGQVLGYTYVPNENNTQYKVSGLKQGVYSYSANAIIDGKKEVASGQFMVKEQHIESLNLTADHHLLRKLSSQSGGAFFMPDQFDQLKAYLDTQEIKGIMYSEEDLLPVIQLPWLMILLLGLAGTEWFFRKYNGGY